MYWPGDSVSPAVRGRFGPITAKSVAKTRNGPRRHFKSVEQEVRRPLVMLKGVPGQAFREPIEPSADGQTGHDDPKIRSAAQVRFPSAGRTSE